MDDLSTETLFNEAVSIKQPKSGYRFTIDPILLAHFVRLTGHEKVMDLGTGSGIIPLILCHRYPNLAVWGIEIQDRLASLARSNMLENNLDGCVTILHGDLTQTACLPPESCMDHVLANPPYIARQAGRLNPSDEKAIARHEIHATLEQLISTASYLLKESGRFSLIFPQSRELELIEKLEKACFYPQTLRRVCPKSCGPAKRILVESIKNTNTDLTIPPPLIIFQEEGKYSDEVKKMFE